MTEENTTQLYEYPLSSPLPFQEGDILGFSQLIGSVSWDYYLNLDMTAECTIFQRRTLLLVS